MIPVLLTVRELDQGGVERDVAKIATHLLPPFQAHVASYYDHGMRYEELKSAGVPMLHLNLESVLSRAAIPAARTLRKYIREHSFRVVHSYDVSGVLAAPVARACGVPAIITSQLSYRDILDSRTRALLRMSDRCAHAVLANCDAIRNYLIECEGNPPERVERIYNGVDTSQFFPGERRRPQELDDAEVVIGTVCALRPEKSLPDLLRAFAQVRARHARLKLVIVGSGPLLATLQETAHELAIQPDTIFVPGTPEVPRWLRGIDIFVLPSRSEAFSNSLLEAMACGCAVIGSRVGGTPELTGEEERGLLFPAGDWAALAERIERLIVNPQLRKDLADRAATYSRDHLSIEIAARRTADMYLRRLGLQAND